MHSPFRLDEVPRASLDQLGPVRHVVAPNRFHHSFLSDYPKNYPDVKIYGAPGLDNKRRDLHFDAILDDTPPPVWNGQIDQIVFRAFGALNETIFFHCQSRTALFTDLVFNVNHSDSALTRFVLGLDGGFRGLAVPRMFRLPIRMRRRLALSTLAGENFLWDAPRIHGELFR